jgi:hypothetical protein
MFHVHLDALLVEANEDKVPGVLSLMNACSTAPNAGTAKLLNQPKQETATRRRERLEAYIRLGADGVAAAQ